MRKVGLPAAEKDVDVIEDERKDEKHDETDAYSGCHRETLKPCTERVRLVVKHVATDD